MMSTDDFFSQLRVYALNVSDVSGSREFEKVLLDGIATANARLVYGKGFPIAIKDLRKDDPFWKFLLHSIDTSDTETLSRYRGMMVSQLEEVRSLNRRIHGKSCPIIVISDK